MPHQYPQTPFFLQFRLARYLYCHLTPMRVSTSHIKTVPSGFSDTLIVVWLDFSYVCTPYESAFIQFQVSYQAVRNV